MKCTCGRMFIPVASVGGPLSDGSAMSCVRQQPCTFIPVNGVRSIMQLRISNHRVITEYEGGGNGLIIDVNVEIINKIAGNALWSVISNLLQDHLKGSIRKIASVA